MSRLHRLCDKSLSIKDGFTSLVKIFEGRNSGKGVEEDGTVGVEIDTEVSEASVRIEEEFQRFDLWARTLGAYQRTHASLDHRVREAPNVQSLTERLLNDLDHNVRLSTNNRHLIIKLTYGFRAQAYEHITTANDQTVPHTEPDDSSSEEDENTWHETETILDVLIGNMSSTIDRLYRVSFHLRNPAYRGDLSKAKSFKDIDPDTNLDIFECYASYDRNHVYEVLRSLRSIELSSSTDHISSQSKGELINPNTIPPENVQGQDGLAKEKGAIDPFETDYLAARLWQANVLRRRQFGYWRHRREKRSAAADEPTINAITDESKDGALEHKAAEEAIGPPTISRPSKATTFVGKDIGIDDTETQISSATYALVRSEANGDDLVFPTLPSGLKEKKEFQCPYCQDVFPASLSKKSAWETHVLRDLRPYICTFDPCEQSDQLFGSMQSWISHEVGVHNLRLSQDISPNIPAALISDFVRRDCPICLHSNATPAHIALHLQKIALFSLPRTATYEEDENADSGESVRLAIASRSVSLFESISDDEELSIQEDSIACSKCGTRRTTPDLMFCDKCNGFFCITPPVAEGNGIDGGDGNAQSCWQEHHASDISHKPPEASVPLRGLDQIPGMADVQKDGLLLSYLEQSSELTSYMRSVDPSTYSASAAGDSAANAGASSSSNAQAFSEMLDQYNQLQQQTTMENMEMQKTQAFWNPLESMSKRDATS